MSYETAPATELVATHCCACGKPLVDAKSVEMGIGPVCRKKHGFDMPVAESVRKQANALVYQIAAAPQGLECLQKIAQVRELGFEVLADRLESRVATVRVMVVEGRVRIVTPYNADFVAGIKKIKGRKWHKAEKVWSFPLQARAALWSVLQGTFDGALAIGPKGPFKVEKAA